MLRRLWGRRTVRKSRAWPRPGLRAQIAGLGVGGVALIGTLYLVGLRFEAEAQHSADESAALATLMANALRQNMLWLIGLTTLAIAALAIYFGRRISRPMALMAGAMHRLADGDLDVALPRMVRHDEIGTMLR